MPKILRVAQHKKTSLEIGEAFLFKSIIPQDIQIPTAEKILLLF
jgi:hypothetical protein